MIDPLPIHPLPEPEDSIGSWIDRLAIANKVSFKIMFFNITNFAKEIGFLQTLSALTGFQFNQILKIYNEFNSEFWNNLTQCPMKNCNSSHKSIGSLFEHLQNYHKLGITWKQCWFCSNLKRKIKLIVNLNLNYYQEKKRELIKCLHCNYETRSAKTFYYHLIFNHNIYFKWIKCPFCEFRDKYRDPLFMHLIKNHYINTEITWYRCPKCKQNVDLKKVETLKFESNNIFFIIRE